MTRIDKLTIDPHFEKIDVLIHCEAAERQLVQVNNFWKEIVGMEPLIPSRMVSIGHMGDSACENKKVK